MKSDQRSSALQRVQPQAQQRRRILATLNQKGKSWIPLKKNLIEKPDNIEKS